MIECEETHHDGNKVAYCWEQINAILFRFPRIGVIFSLSGDRLRCYGHRNEIEVRAASKASEKLSFPLMMMGSARRCGSVPGMYVLETTVRSRRPI